MESLTYFTKDDSVALKAIMSFFIISHHIYQRMSSEADFLVDYVLRSFGYLAVGAFFFISGYGVTYSLRQSGGGCPRTLTLDKH